MHRAAAETSSVRRFGKRNIDSKPHAAGATFMILFHVESLDLDAQDVRSRAWLPAGLLRRAGMPSRLVEGDVPASLAGAASCIVVVGRVSESALSTARRASRAGVPIVLDVGDGDALTVSTAEPDQRQRFIEAAGYAGAITAGNAMLAHRIEQLIDAKHIVVAADPIGFDDDYFECLLRYPRAAARLIAKRIANRGRDVFADVRGRWRGPGPAGRHCRRIVWFGASRRPNGEGGVAELLLAAGDLVDLAAETPLRIDVVGRSPRWTRRYLKHLGMPVSFHRYSPARVRRQLRKADLCLLPGGDPAGSARSPARENLAIALGIPTVTSAGDRSLLPQMRAALADRATALGQQDANRQTIMRDHGGRAVTAAWRHAIDVARSSLGQRSPAQGIVLQIGQRLRVQFLLQQFQDLDLIVPIAEAASSCADLDVRVAVLAKISIPASRRLRTIHGNGGKIEFRHAPDLLNSRLAAACFAADVAVTASEGPGFGARFARAFVAGSLAAGARVVSLQHGLDNGGLTYGPQLSPRSLMSDVILTWGGLDRLTHAACPETRAKVIPVGCPKRLFAREDFRDFPYADRPFIAVFENLHWRRYGESYRARFVEDLVALAESAPDLTFVLKPHMGGQWFTRRGHAARPLPANLKVADPTSPEWRRFTADAFLVHASAVITTPSTIALDAARYGVPAALVSYGISAQNYAPLPRLERREDWLDFAEQIRRGVYDRKRLESFLADAALPGDVVARILTVIRMAGARRPLAEILSSVHASLRGVAAS